MRFCFFPSDSILQHFDGLLGDCTQGKAKVARSFRFGYADCLPVGKKGGAQFGK